MDAPPSPIVDVDLSATLVRLTEQVEGINATLVGLRRDGREADERAAARERVIDRQHADLEKLRVGERHTLLRPLLVELQRLRDDLLRQTAGLPEQVAGGQMASLLESYAYSTELILARAGVEVMRPEIGSAFDPRRHRAAAVAAAPSPDLDGTIAQVISDGYLDLATDRLLATAAVTIHRWQPPSGGSESPLPVPAPVVGDADA